MRSHIACGRNEAELPSESEVLSTLPLEASEDDVLKAGDKFNLSRAGIAPEGTPAPSALKRPDRSQVDTMRIYAIRWEVEDSSHASNSHCSLALQSPLSRLANQAAAVSSISVLLTFRPMSGGFRFVPHLNAVDRAKYSQRECIHTACQLALNGTFANSETLRSLALAEPFDSTKPHDIAAFVR